jgi:L-alanine-DL-glutamate epimerase-like enolase superfamily enzyme
MTPMTTEITSNEKGRLRITAIKVIQLKGHGIQSLVKVETSEPGLHGIGEIGGPAVMARAYLKHLASKLIGQDPLEIDRLLQVMTRMQTQFFAHWVHNPTVAGIDIALWDIAGKVMNRSVSHLLTGRFRETVQLYVNTLGPADWLDKASCRDWADEIKADPNGWKVVKFGFERMIGRGLLADRYQGGYLSKMLTPAELRIIGQGYENCREALGWDIDFIVHCHNEWDVPTAIGLSEAVAPAKPLWIEDALPVPYSESWTSYREQSKVRVLTGEKLEFAHEFLQFMQNRAVDAIHPDIAFTHGISGIRKIADLAEMFYIPVVTHNIGSIVQLLATAHFGASCRNFVMTENRIPQGELYEVLATEPLLVKNGELHLPNAPGLGITLNDDFLRRHLDDGEVYWE